MPMIELAGRRMPVALAFGTTRACEVCDAPFVVTNISGRQLYCGRRCNRRARWMRESVKPGVVAENRARCREWAAAHRAVERSNTWLIGAPPYGEYLPGGAFTLRVTPALRWPIELRNTRALHGMVTDLIGKPHDPQVPGFVLIPSNAAAVGWGVYLPNAEDALQLAGRQVSGVLFDRNVVVSCGPMHRIKAPRVTKRGRRRLHIDIITPVCVRSDGGTYTYRAPTSANLCATLAAWLPRRLGVAIGPTDIRLLIVERNSQVQWTPLGEKYGTVGGFVGSLIVETNAVGEWLLRCAESVGLGGKTAFGFGRIRVTGS